MTWPFPKEPRGHSLSSIHERHWATLGDLWFKLWNDHNHNHNHKVTRSASRSGSRHAILWLRLCRLLHFFCPKKVWNKSSNQGYTMRNKIATFIFQISYMSRGNFKGCRRRKNDEKNANNSSHLQVHSDFWQTEKWVAATDMPLLNNTQRDASLKEIKQTLGPRHLKISLGRLGRHRFQNFNHIQPRHTKTPSLGWHPLWVEWAYNKRTTIIPTLQLYPSLVFWGSLYICISILNVCLKTYHTESFHASSRLRLVKALERQQGLF